MPRVLWACFEPAHTEMRYKAIIFDLFDTIVCFDYGRMPEVVVGGAVRRTTMGKTYEILRERYPELGRERFFQALAETDEELRPQRDAGREVPSRERFRRLLGRLDPGGPNAISSEYVDSLVARHMKALLDCAYLPQDRHRILSLLGRHYRLGLLSNFDHAPAAHRMLDEMELRKYFTRVAISGEVGWRKPHPRLFFELLGGLGVSPAGSLYVGDTHETDVVGAKGAGLDAAWLNLSGRVLEEGEVRPDIETSSLEELTGRLIAAAEGETA